MEDETEMLDREQDTASAASQHEPDTDEQEVEAEASGDQPDDDAEADVSEIEGEGSPAEFAEIEFNGKKYHVPAELKDGFLMQADYTRKRQADAEFARGLEAKAREIDALRNVAQEELNARATMMGINQRLQQYQHADWNALFDEDPTGAQKHWIEYQQLEKQAGQVGQYLQNAEARRTEAAQHDTAKRIQETRAFAEKEIPNWSEEIDARITQFAMTDLGFTSDTLADATSPAVYRTLYLAWVGAQAMQNGAGRKPAQPQTIMPLKTVSAKSSGTSTRDPSEMSMEEYDKWARKRFKS